MEYKDKIIALLLISDDAYFNWLEEQPKMLQPDIMREFKEVMTEILHENGITDQDDQLELLEMQAKEYEKMILEEHLEPVNKQLDNLAIAAEIRKLEQTPNGIRNYVKNCIITNTDDADAMRYMAKTMMALEKQNGTYDENNWVEIL